MVRFVLVCLVAACTGGQTGDPGDLPVSCGDHADCRAAADAMLRHRIERTDGARADSGTGGASVRTAACRGRACVIILRIGDSCYVGTSARAHDCALTDDEILNEENDP
jgi:hypothetical protein